MTNLEKLKEKLNLFSDSVNETSQIKEVAELLNIANDIEAEQNEIISKHNELKAEYKKAVMHSSFKEKPVDTALEHEPVSFEDMLAQFVNK